MVDSNNTGSTAISRGSIFYIAIGWILAFVSLVVYPFIFGVLGVVMGILATKRGSKAGLTVIVANILFMAVGLIFGGAILNYARRVFGL